MELSAFLICKVEKLLVMFVFINFVSMKML